MAVTLTTTYQKVAEGYIGYTGYADVYLRLYAKYNSQSIANNTSSVSYKSAIYFGTGTFYSGNTTTKSIYGDGATGVSGANAAGNYSAGETVLNEITGTVTHDSNGAKSVYSSANFTSTPWGWNASVEASCILPTIPRYATSNQSLNSKTETTIKMNWSSDNTIDYIWYSKNNGTSWTGVDVTDGESGTYTISGLTANTTYTIKTRVRRKDSQLTTDSSALSVTTYKVPTNALNSREETTAKINWSIDSTADYIWYSKDNGSNWTAVGSVNATSGTYTISGLSANTTYNIKTRVRRKATQSTYDTAAVSVTTYDFPYCIESPNFTISNSGVTLKFYNPLKRTFSFNVIANGVQLEYTWQQAGGTSHLCFDGATTQAQLYATIPNKQSSTYQVKVTYGSSVKTRNNGNTFKINPDICKPTFNNFTYVDIDGTVVTDNNQILVNGNSDCQFVISTSNKAVAKNSATMVSYKCEYGSNSGTINYSSDSSVSTWLSGTGGTLKVTAIDSRGLSTTVTKTVPYIAYTKAVVNNVEIQRLNGVDLETYLGLKMTIWKGNWQNGSNTAYDNQLKYVGYRVYDGSSWTSYFDITDTVKSNMSSSTSGSSTVITLPLSKKIAIHANGSSGGFTIGKEYKIQVLIKDGTSTKTFTPYSYQATAQGTVPDGKVGFSRYKDSDGNYHYAINGMPEKNENFTIHGSLFIDGTAGSASASTGKISFGNDGVAQLFLSANTNKSLYFNTSATDNSTQIGYDGLNVSFRPSSSNKNALLGLEIAPWAAVYANKFFGTSTKLGAYTTLTAGTYNAIGWRLVTTLTCGTWNNRRWLFGISSRHNGNGILAIALDTHDTIANYNYNIRYFGTTTGVVSSAWRVFYNTSTGVFRLYYHHNDHSPCKITPLTDNPSEISNGTWYTELPSDNGSELTVQYNYIDSAGTSSKVKVTNTNPSTFSGYYPAWVSSSGDNADLHINNGCVYQTVEGTTSSNGMAQLVLGNSTASGTAGNKRGRVTLFGFGSGYVHIDAPTTTNGYAATFPAYSGDVVVSTSGTNYEKLSDGTLIIYGDVTCPSLGSAQETTVSITLPVAFVNTNYRVNLTPTGTGVYWSFLAATCQTKATGTATIKFYNNGAGTAAACKFDFIAIGRWK